MGETRDHEIAPLQRAAMALKEMRERLECLERDQHEPIAVVAAGCRLPGADDIEDLWKLLKNGVDASRDIPADRFVIDALYDPDPDAAGKICTRRAALIDGVDMFDVDFFGISHREARAMDPQQRLLLETSWETFERAGIRPLSLQGQRIGVFAGLMNHDYARLASGRIETHSGTGQSAAVASGRLAHFYGVSGPALTVDTSCSSSLVAVHLAMQSLRRRECDGALAGGVNLILSPEPMMAESRAHMLAPDGRTKAFDAAADGMSRGEGCGLVYLMRLSDAEREKRPVIAILRGSAMNHDGQSSGLTVPNEAAQEDVIRAALADARVAPEQIGYVETHGTGTPLGDPIEVAALGRVFASRSADAPLWIGSIKTNIGHLEGAAGIAGLLKTILCLRTGIIPPSLHFLTPNPAVPWETIPVRVAATETCWTDDGPRYAGISSFGASGTNVHIVVESARAPARKFAPQGRGYLIALSARDEKALDALAHAFARRLEHCAEEELPDLCYTANVTRERFVKRLAVAGCNAAQLRAALLGSDGPAGSVDSQLALAAELWRNGAEPEWNTLDSAINERQVVIAPTYPFQRKRFWLDSAQAARTLDYLYRIEWQPRPLQGVVWRSPSRIVARATAAPPGEPAEFALARCELEAVASGFIARALVDLADGIAPRFRQLLRRYQSIIAATAEIESDPEARLRRFQARHPAFRVEAELLARCGPNLASVLSGKRDALELLFPPGREEAVRLYSETPAAAAMNRQAAELVGSGLSSQTAPYRLRVLEIGAGTGGVTSCLLPLFDPACTEYVFTDVSPSFLAAARGRFAASSFVKYERFDAESSTDVKRIGEASVDLVVASNVLHATQDLRGTLARVSRLLRPAGLLLLVEATRREAWIDATFGLTDGWWRFTDHDVRPDYPLLDAPGWIRLLEEAGFVDSQAVSPAEIYPQQTVFLARNAQKVRRWAVLGENKIAEALAAGLRELGEIVEANGTTADEIVDLRACESAVSLDHADRALTLLQQSHARRSRAWLITPADEASSVIWGLGRTANREMNGSCRLVDIQPSAPAQQAAAALLRELLADDREHQVRWRNGQRLAARFVAAARSAPIAPTLRTNRTYVVIGSTGLGLEAAEWLVQRGCRRMVLASRRGETPESSLRVRQWRERGVEVWCESLDVTQANAVDALLRRFREQPIAGVVLAAGVLEDAALARQRRGHLERVLSPKIEGAMNLYAAVRTSKLDFFLLFSSAAAAFGNPGQANHAAANAFLDAYAEQLRHAGVPAVSIGWGPVTNVGAAAGEDVVRRLELSGFTGLTLPQVHAVLDAAVAESSSYLCAVHVDWQRFSTNDPFFERLKPAVVNAAPVWQAETTPSSCLEIVLHETAAVLGRDASEPIDADLGFFELGLDSLAALELRERLRKRFGVELASTVAFDYKNPRELAAYLENSARPVFPAPSSDARNDSEPIAVVGMACRFPGGADNPEAFWQLLEDGRDAVGYTSSPYWNAADYYSPDMSALGRIYVREGAFLGPLDGFDAAFFRIAPREAECLDPQHRLLLETSWEAIEHSAIPVDRLQQNSTGVFVGIGGCDYATLLTDGGLRSLDAYTGAGTSPSAAAGRVSFTLGFRGPSLSVNTACSSSLVALHLAVRSLRQQECDAALAGGVNLMLTPDVTVMGCRTRMLSPDGRSKAFDASADGYGRGEGCGVVVLKRLSDALRDRDRIVAVIRGSAVNHDGKTSGFTVPSGSSQQEVIRLALRDAGAEPDEIGYIEAHGTGTALGDPIEIGALSAVFGARSAGSRLWMGSVKTNIGHLEAAAGIAGLMKAALSVQRGMIPRSLHFRNPSPQINWGKTPLRVASEPVRWDGPLRRMAGISSFGMSGTNAHVIIEEPPAAEHPVLAAGPLLLAISARSAEALSALTMRYAERLAQLPDEDVPDFCWTANTGRTSLAYRLAVWASDCEEFRSLLATAARGKTKKGICRGSGTGAPVPSARDPEELGRAWVAGAAIDWRSIALPRRKLDVPTYAWQRKRYWVPVASAAPVPPPGRAVEVAGSDILCFEYAAGPQSPSWISDHRIGRTVLMPASGFVMLALASLREEGAAGPVQLSDVLFARPLALDHPMRVQTLVRQAERGWSIQVLSRSQEASTREWALHAQMSASRSTAKFSPASIVAANESITPSDFYLKAERYGAELGPTFRTIRELSIDRDRASARIEAEEGAWSGALLLDGCLQLAGAFLPEATATGPFVPAGIEDLWLGGELKSPLRVAAKRARGDTLRVELQAWSEEGELVLTASGVRFAASPKQEPAWRDWLYEIEWRSQPRFGPAAQFFGCTDFRASLSDPDSRYAENLTLLDQMAVGWLRSAFEALGNPAAAIHPRYRRALPRWQKLLATTPANGRRAALPTGVEHEFQMLARCGERLPDLLRGELDATEVLFPNGDMQDAAKLYSESQAAQRINQILRDVIAQIQACQPVSVGLRVLEIGGGTGAATRAALAGLRPGAFKYTWTDIGPSFVKHAAESFGNPTGAMTFCVLDIDRDPAEQGITAGAYDLVLASNVLHAAQDVRRAVRHAHSLLAPGGLLLLLETLKSQPWVDLTFGLTEGWWHFEDTDLRSDGPLLPLKRWQQVLEECGFERSWCAGPEPEHLPAVGWQAVLAAQKQASADVRKKQWLLVGDSANLADALSVHGACTTLPETATTNEIAGVIGSREEWSGVVYLPALFTEDVTDARRICEPLLWLVSVFAGMSSPPPVWVLTRGGAAVDGNVRNPAGALLWGMARVISLEHPGLTCRCLDLDPDEPSIADGLAEELLANFDEPRYALRDGKRYVERLARKRPVTGPVRAAFAPADDAERVILKPAARRSPGPGEVELQIHAAGLNFRDVLMSMGAYPGATCDPGLECAGIIAAVGAGVDGLSLGDQVVAIAPGCFAHYLTIPASRCFRYNGMTQEDAATVPSAFLTAVYALEMLAQLRAGERVLIHSAAGAVGQAAIQIAVRRGAHVFATASVGKQELVRQLGIEHVFDSRSLSFAENIRQATQGSGVHVVLNTLTGNGFIPASLSILAPGGRFVELSIRGAWSREQIAQHRPDVQYIAVNAAEWMEQNADEAREVLERVLQDLAVGELRPIGYTALALSDVAEAFRRMERAEHTGKIIICPDPLTARVRGDGTYLITGGLGGLGLRLAEWLASNGCQTLALVQRRPPASDEQMATIEMLRQKGVAVHIFPCDVADGTALRATLAAIRADLPPLVGVFHLAGSLDDAPAHRMSWPQFESVLGGKAAGAWTLHTQTLGDRLDWFVLFSAAAGVLGNPGQVNHAAANAFLDALAHFRHSLGLPALSLDLGPVAEVGAAARLGLTEATKLDAAGVGSIPPDAVFSTLDTLLDSSVTQVLLCPIDWARFRQAAASSMYRELIQANGAAQPAQAPARQKTRDVKSKADVARLIREELAAVVRLDPDEIKPAQPFFDLGLDSLTALELRSRLESTLHIDIPSTFAFEQPTPHDLLEYLAARLFGAEPEEDVAALLEAEIRSIKAGAGL